MEKYKISKLECADCGNILKKEDLPYAVYIWKYCPLCAGKLRYFNQHNKEYTPKLI